MCQKVPTGFGGPKCFPGADKYVRKLGAKGFGQLKAVNVQIVVSPGIPGVSNAAGLVEVCSGAVVKVVPTTPSIKFVRIYIWECVHNIIRAIAGYCQSLLSKCGILGFIVGGN